MITLDEIRQAMRLLNEATNTMIYRRGNITLTKNDQLALSLQVYLGRGEYEHGNLDQAVSCLKQAGYEIRKDLK